jgi:hypothetical protein
VAWYYSNPVFVRETIQRYDYYTSYFRTDVKDADSFHQRRYSFTSFLPAKQDNSPD